MASLARDLRHVLAVAFSRAETDVELLRRFVSSRDESAFAEIVRRHGPAVLRICRNLLPPTDADDAFQATFFVLARRAESLSSVSSLSGWLVGVAGRVARQLRKAGWRRGEVEKKYRPHDFADECNNQNLKELDEELTRLPERLRDPVVLCFLEEKTQEEAAATLGQSVRTIRRRLDRAKEVLRLRLERRGVVPVLLVSTSSLVISSATAARTAANAVQFLTGGCTTPAATLAKGFAVTAVKWKVAATLTVAAGLLTALGSGVAQDVPKSGTQPNQPKVEMRPKPLPAPEGAVFPPDREGVMFTFHTDDYSGEESIRGVRVSAPNQTTARVIRHEAEHQLDLLATHWFGKAPEKLPYKLFIDVKLTGSPNGSAAKKFDDKGNLVEVGMMLYGPLEPMLYDQLPCEIAHVVLAAHLGSDIPAWADAGLAFTTTSPEHQAHANTAIRQFLNAGKGIRLKHLFGMKLPDEKQEWAVFATQSTSLVRFLEQAAIKKSVPMAPAMEKIPYLNRLFNVEPERSKEVIRFMKVGSTDGWEKAASTVYGFDSLDQLEKRWLEWMKSDDSRLGLPAVTPVLPPAVAEPARIPPVNLGK